MAKPHLVTVLGREIPVRSAASEEKVREVETFVNGRIELLRQRLTIADPQLIISLAMLNLAEEFLTLQANQTGTDRLENRLSNILDRLDQAL